MAKGNVDRESQPFLQPIDRNILQDPSSGLPGFVASELEQQEENLQRDEQSYGSIRKGSVQTSTHDIDDDDVEEFQISPARIRIIMISMYLGIFLAALDNTVVSTLLAHIASEFNELPRISWIATAYLLSSATFQPLYGKISDIFGRKPLLVFSNIFFCLGCLMCGLSPGLWWLVAGRFVAGIGGGGITSMSSITTSDIVPLRDRALYQGICNFFFGLGTACGGLIGGWFTEHGGGWRMAFLIQVPACILSCGVLVTFLELPPRKHDSCEESTWKSKLARVDWWGVLFLVVFLLLAMLASSLGGKEIAYNSKLFITLCVLILISGSMFAYIETHVAIDPVLPISFLKNRTILGASLANWFCMMAAMTTNYYLPVYWAGVLDMKPTDMGKRTIPSFFSTALGSLGAGYYMKRTGRYYKFLMGFCLLAVVGQLQINLITPSIAVWRQYILQLVPGLGVSVLITVTLLAMIAAVPHEHQAATTSISYAFRSTGCTLGVSIGGAIFRSALSSLLQRNVMKFASDGHSSEELTGIIENATHSSEWVHRDAPEFVRATLIECYHFACKYTYAFCLTTVILAMVSCAIIKEYKLHTSIKR
ncbi:LAFE_0H09230g1_1 [Lachancea fermentati]|uniref:LAFE_0H09230g1_1 n=1 Tax=Lachancea fermentati TaxID=4955 RepID=A0A1G4MK42_LACFM|nr:LAFE_0H09230g1_1 [Lachancea fermentati]